MRPVTIAAACLMLLSLSAAAQQAEPKLEPPRPMINVKMDRATVAEALQKIGDLSGISIQYADNLSGSLTTELVTLTFVNTPAQDVLGFVVRIAKLSYTVVDAKTIRVEPARTP